MKNKLTSYLDWRNILHPFWQRMPIWLQRQLIWRGATKFLVGVAMICMNSEGQILLVNHRFHNDIPWGLPGGWVDRGEAPLDAGLREVREETGLDVVVDGVVGWVERIGAGHHFVIVDYRTTVLGDADPTADTDAAEARWVPLWEVPELDLVEGLLDFLADHKVIDTL